MLLNGSLTEIKEAAAKGRLSWNGKKVIFDPFLKIRFFYEIEPLEAGNFSLRPRVKVGSREEDAATYELLTDLGALQGGTFRLWENPDQFEKYPEKVSGKELEKLIKEGLSHKFRGEKPRIKPAPHPVLRLIDRSGGFATLHMEYGEWGEEPFQNQTEEERYWEKDLLETGFKRRGSEYYCPLDIAPKSLAFLLEMGWKIFDARSKRVVKQSGIECSVEETGDALILKGTARFGEQEHPILDVSERWVDLSPHEVGLLELSPAWYDLADEEKTPSGIRVRKSHIGMIADIVPTFRPALWEEKTPASDFRGTLYPYQQKGLSWLWFLYQAGFSGLLADEMGLGKTIQVLAFLSLREGPALIVMPVTLLALWRQQIETFLPGSDITLVSYAMLRARSDEYYAMNFDTIVLDEAQMIKNAETQIAQTVFRLKSRFKLALTGTPIENRTQEVASLFHFLMPGLCSASDINYKKLRPFILRRTKEEVGLDLPEKIIQTIGVDPSEEEMQRYDTLLQTKRGDQMEVLELILRLRQHACHPRLVDPSYTGEPSKFSQVLHDIAEVVASKHKVLLYSQFTSVLQLFRQQFEERGWNYVYLDGSTKDRETPVREFQNNADVSIFLISLKAGGVGLNLQAADYVFLYDPWWNSAVENQAIDRTHRIGRKNPVIARKYFTTQTIEAKILELQSKKAELAQGLWNENPVETLSYEQLIELLI